MNFEFGGRTFEPDIRYLRDLKKVLLYPESIENNDPAYYMYRDLFYSLRDREIIRENNLRFDITIIPPRTVGREYIKTLGHYHPLAEKNLSYPEIYEVISGEAVFLIQREDSGSVIDVLAISARSGDKVIIPPNFGHVTINSSRNVLKMSNWVSRNFSSVYEPYLSRKGACYYLTLNGWEKNKNYSKIPELIEITAPPLSKYGIRKNKEMYALIREPEKLEFLNHPSRYVELFTEIYDIEY